MTLAAQARAKIEARARRIVMEQEEARERLKSSAKNNLLDFVRLTHAGYQAGWVHEHVCSALERFVRAIERGESPRLILSMPPRHGKSAIVSRRLPIWFLGRNPALKVILATYGQSLSSDMSRDAKRVRDAVLDLGVWPHLATGPKCQDTEAAWEISGGGGMFASGIRGGITGKGASLIIVDDPVKSREQAESPTIRKKTWTGFTDDLLTRLAPGGGVIVMATRWHEDDLIGRLLRAQAQGDGEQYEVINFPAIAIHDEEHRAAGEALHPSRYPLKVLESRRRAMGGRSFAALYQGSPQPAQGSLFHASWFTHRYECTPRAMAAKCDRRAISVDATFGSKSDTASWTVIQVWGRIQGRMALLHQVRERLNYPDTKRVLRDLVMSWGVRECIVERKANGPALIDELSSELDCAVIGFEPGARSKETRAAMNSVPAVEAGDVLLPQDEDAPWLQGDGVQGYIPEHLAFPHATNDDQVDATSQLIEHWRSNELRGRIWSDGFLGKPRRRAS